MFSQQPAYTSTWQSCHQLKNRIKNRLKTLQSCSSFSLESHQRRKSKRLTRGTFLPAGVVWFIDIARSLWTEKKSETELTQWLFFISLEMCQQAISKGENPKICWHPKTLLAFIVVLLYIQINKKGWHKVLVTNELVTVWENFCCYQKTRHF